MSKKIAYTVSFLGLIVLISIFMKPVESNGSEVGKVEGYTTYLTDYEFSDLTMAWGKLYCVGVEGVFEIEPENETARHLITDLAYVKSIVYDEARDGLWIGHSKGVSFYDGHQLHVYEEFEKLSKTEVNDILLTEEGMYIGTFDGLFIVENLKIKECLTDTDGLIDKMVNVLYQDSEGMIWCGAYTANGGGVSLIDKNQVIKTFNVENGLVHNAITTILETNDHKVLIGGGVYTDGGVTVFSKANDEWFIEEYITKDDGLIGEKVRHIFSYDDLLWFCSEYDGITIMNDREVIAVLTDKNGLSDNEAKRAYIDENNHLYLATRRGITMIKREVMEDILDY